MLAKPEVEVEDEVSDEDAVLNEDENEDEASPIDTDSESAI